MKVKEESEKVGLKLSIQKTKIMASSPITSLEIDGVKYVCISPRQTPLSIEFSRQEYWSW